MIAIKPSTVIKMLSIFCVSVPCLTILQNLLGQHCPNIQKSQSSDRAIGLWAITTKKMLLRDRMQENRLKAELQGRTWSLHAWLKDYDVICIIHYSICLDIYAHLEDNITSYLPTLPISLRERSICFSWEIIKSFHTHFFFRRCWG